ILNLGLPKGSLQDSTVAMFANAGWKISVKDRSYFPSIDDPEVKCCLIRAQEMARYVGEGLLDCGLTGYDWVVESGADTVEIAELVYGKSGTSPLRWVVAVPADSDIKCAKDLQGKRIATEAVGMTQRYLAKNGVTANVEFSWGATEVKPPHLADAIVEITETGSSLKANNLVIIDTVCTTTTRFIANRAAAADPWKRAKMERMAMLLKAVLAAEHLVGLMMNVPKDKLQQVQEMLPAMQRPTIANLAGGDWYSLTTVIDKNVARELIPALKQAGAEGLVEYSLTKVVE
ncbi:MAG: ATP phosphoribosyltransferase, partial [Victivallales bacterium]|nr:ATP phosphoribosyltransferase [Victivallales bacterium]